MTTRRRITAGGNRGPRHRHDRTITAFGVVVSVATCAGLLVGLAQSVWATAPGTNGVLAWEADQVASPNRALIEVEGNNITPPGVSDFYPAWSPDGTQIAFNTSRGPGIWIMNADGSAAHAITSGKDFDPDWSPDGTRIAYICAGSGSTGSLCMVNADGTESTVLHNSTLDDAPSWAPDNSKIAFTSWDHVSYDVYTYDLATQATTQLTTTSDGDEYDTSWSPDGTKIAYDGGFTGLEYIDVSDPGNPISLDQPNGATPAWSPDGTKIAFSAYGVNLKYDLFEMDADGSNVVQLTSTGSLAEEWVAWQPLLTICSHPTNGMSCGPGHVLPPGTGHVSHTTSRFSSSVFRRQGYLVPDQAAYERAKQRAAATMSSPAAEAQTSALAPGAAAHPTKLRSWKGAHDPTITPSDSTGAIGISRYVELVNTRFAIYDRSNNSPLAVGTLAVLGDTTSTVLGDPQVMWDPDTSRFYYVVLQYDYSESGTGFNELLFGFSTTDSPSSSSDFCHYSINFGRDFPDYPKLGDTKDFALVGVNLFPSDGGGGRADVVAITKPPAGATCLAGSSLALTDRQGLQNQDGTPTQTPVPVIQSDGDPSGWIVGIRAPESCPCTAISLFEVFTNPDGTPNISETGRDVPVPAYELPPNAPQAGTGAPIDTSDTRLTQAVSAIDPRFGIDAIWTQHTVSGTFGSEVQWLEIDPATVGVFQTGRISSTDLFVFNGAVAPDRVVNGSTTAFGSDMILGYNTSSTTTDVGVWMVSKVADRPVSSPVALKRSPGPDTDYSCLAGTCSWGDYAAATPDPAAPISGKKGRVWLTSMWNLAGMPSGGAVVWRTWNWAAIP